MNIKLKAALEVTGIIVAAAVVVAGVQSVLSAATAAYEIDAVLNGIAFGFISVAALNGIAFGFISVAAYTCVGLLYDQRVAKLQYQQKLKEINNK
jgi:hypothetical protein